MFDNSKILAFIAKCDDAKELKKLILNARKKGESLVVETAFRRLISLVPSERPGSVEFDFWRSINAFEYLLTDERGKTTLLSRTRQKVKRVGEVQTLTDWALSNTQSDGFTMLLERQMPELTGEAIILRHPRSFKPNILAAAKRRLEEAGVNVAALKKA